MFHKRQLSSRDAHDHFPEPVPEEQKEPARAPASALNEIMGKLGLAREEDEPAADETDLARALTDPAWGVRVEAVQKLGKMGRQAPLELLLVALGDEQSNVRVAAARALSRNPRRAAISALVIALEDGTWMVRVEVARALGMLAEPVSLEPLILIATDENPVVRAAAIRALGGFEPERILETLNTALQDGDWSVREAAALTLGQMGTRAAIPSLLNARLDSDASVRAAAEEGLRSLYPEFLSLPPQRSDSFTQWLTRIDYFSKQNPSPARQSLPPVRRHSLSTLRERAVRTTQTTVAFFRKEKPGSATVSQHRPLHFEELAGGLSAALLMTCLFTSWLIIAAWPHSSSSLENQSTPTFTTYRGHTSSVSQLAWSPNGLTIASADIRGTVQIWQASTGQRFLSYPHEGEVLALTWENATTVEVAYAEMDKELQVYALNIGSGPRYEMLLERTDLAGTPQTAAWSPDGQFLAFDTGNGQIQIWDPATHLSIATILNKPTQYSQLSWSPDGSQLASIAVDGRLQLWNGQTGHNSINLAVAQQVSIATWIVYSKPTLCMLFINTSGTILKWTPTRGSTAYTPLIQQSAYNLEGSINLSVGALTVSPDGTQITMATSDGLVQARDSTTMNLVDVYNGHSAQVNDVEWSPDDRYIATASADTTVQIWQEP